MKQLELTKKNFQSLKDYCKKYDIEFMSSPFDNESFDIIKKLKVKYIKIPSGEINNFPLLRLIGKSKKKLFFRQVCLI